MTPSAIFPDGHLFVTLPDYHVVALSGSDRADYLNRRCSQKVLGMADGECRRAFILNAVGKIEADFDVVEDTRNNRFLLISNGYRGAELASLLDRYIFSEDCAVEEWSARRVVLVGSAHSGIQAELIYRSPLLNGLTVAVNPSGLETASEIPLSDYEAFRIRQGFLEFGKDFTEENIPLEAGLVSGLHFDKGCYPGQETIATITNLGHPAKVFVQLQAAGAIPPGTPIYSGDQEVGRVTSTTMAEEGSTIALGWLKWRHREGKEQLLCANIPLTVIRILSTAQEAHT